MNCGKFSKKVIEVTMKDGASSVYNFESLDDDSFLKIVKDLESSPNVSQVCERDDNMAEYSDDDIFKSPLGGYTDKTIGMVTMRVRAGSREIIHYDKLKDNELLALSIFDKGSRLQIASELEKRALTKPNRWRSKQGELAQMISEFSPNMTYNELVDGLHRHGVILRMVTVTPFPSETVMPTRELINEIYKTFNEKPLIKNKSTNKIS